MNGNVELQVQDDGPGLLPGELSGHEGVGLANTRARLQQLYGQEAKFEIENGDRGGAVVTMRIPFHDVQTEPGRTYVPNNPDRG